MKKAGKPPIGKEKIVEIKKVFANKNPRLARLIPEFVFRFLRHIVREDFVNEFLNQYGHLKNRDFAVASIKYFNVSLHVKGMENIPKEGRFIFVANHPLGGFDGIVLIKIISEYFPSYKFLVNDILMNVFPLKDVFIPINKHGKQALESARQVEAAYASDLQLITFPAGLVSRKTKGQIMDLPWQKSFINKAIKHQRSIIPIHFSGQNTKFFYSLANVRKFFGIKANIEMLFLMDETYKHRNKHLTIKIGKPIDYHTFDKRKKPLEWAKWVKEKVYALDMITHVPF